MIVRERVGDTLTGAIDGANTVYLTTIDYAVDHVAVFQNGLLLDPSVDNGYTLTAPRTVTLKEPALPGDTLEVEYRFAPGIPTGGGAEGGVPDPPELLVLAPKTYTEGESVPSLETDNLEPTMSGQELRPTIGSEDLRPAIVPLRGENGGGCGSD